MLDEIKMMRQGELQSLQNEQSLHKFNMACDHENIKDAYKQIYKPHVLRNSVKVKKTNNTMMSSFDMNQSIKHQTHETFCQMGTTFEEDVLAQARKELLNKPMKQKFTPISPIREMQPISKRDYLTSSRVLNSQPENTYKISN